MGWGGALLMLFGLLGGFCLVWIVAAESRDEVIRQNPQPDSRIYSQKDWK
jgi:hypothetical protein